MQEQTQRAIVELVHRCVLGPGSYYIQRFFVLFCPICSGGEMPVLEVPLLIDLAERNVCSKVLSWLCGRKHSTVHEALGAGNDGTYACIHTSKPKCGPPLGPQGP